MASTVPTSVKRSFLRDAYDASIAASITLYAQLRAWETASRESIGTTGQIVSSTSSGNAVGSHAVSFFPPNIGLNPVDLLTFLGELVDLHDLVLTSLGLTNSEGNRDAIKNEMMGLLVPARFAELDFTALRAC